MRNQEAERYARWAATTAAGIALIVAGVYGERAIRASRLRHKAPPAVAQTVQQQSAKFEFSKVEQDRTIFTIRASQATQFKDQNRALLEDVWITVYGHDGTRNDNIHTRECSYEPKTGAVRCEGDVEIDIQGSNPASGKPTDKSLQVKTRNLSFNRETGEASTPEAAEFEFPEGKGRGVGVVYDSKEAVVRVEHAIEMDLAAAEKTGGLPLAVRGNSMEIRRNDRKVILHGPATVQQGPRELTAQVVSFDLDAEFRVQGASAEGHPLLHSTENGEANVSAEKFEGTLSPAGWVQRVVAEGGVVGERRSRAGQDHFSAAHAEFRLLPEKNLLKELTATGGVALSSTQSGESRSLKTESLRVMFAHGERADQQRIESAETLAPGTIETKTKAESAALQAEKFVAQFSAGGKLEKLLGHSGIEVRRQFGKAAPQVSTAAELTATFSAQGEWATLDEEGDVRFQQGDHQATAAHANINRAADVISLEGSPVLIDSQSRTTAATVTIQQKSGEIDAKGGVASTFLTAPGGGVNLGSGPAHISADSLAGSTASGHVIYSGHARLWQGESVLEADRIELWREERKMQATGHVVAVFPQAPGQLGGATAKASSQPSEPTLWHIQSPSLTYWNDSGKARLEGGVTASSQQGELVSRTLDVFLSQGGSNGAAQSASGSAKPSNSGGRQLDRALAQGKVVVRQGDRLGKAEQAEYTAVDGKFVLSGGEPMLTDAANDTTTGRSLTFFVAGDTILVDSQEGSRTLTKHRVEK